MTKFQTISLAICVVNWGILIVNMLLVLEMHSISEDLVFGFWRNLFFLTYPLAIVAVVLAQFSPPGRKFVLVAWNVIYLVIAIAAGITWLYLST